MTENTNIKTPSGDYTMRLMRETDRGAVLEMMRVFYASDATFTCGSDEIFESDITACISDSPFIDGFVFADEEDEPRGYAMIAHSFNTENGKLSIRVEDLYLCEQARGHGLASLFFDYISEKYPDRVLTLETEPENIHARGIYKRRGFEDLPYTEMIKVQN